MAQVLSVIGSISLPHHLVQELFEKGQITEEGMRSHPRKNIVTSCLLGNSKREIPAVFTYQVPVGIGERFLICSDGVWESMDGSELSEIVVQHSIEEASNILARKVIEYGARDNFMFIIAEME